MLKTILEQYRNGERGMPTYDELAAIVGGDHDGHARINGGVYCAQAEARPVAELKVSVQNRAARYFVYDGENGYQEYATDVERADAHEATLRSYCDYDSGWFDGVTDIVSGVVTHVTRKSRSVPNPDHCEGCECEACEKYLDAGGSNEFCEICDYKVEPLYAHPSAEPCRADNVIRKPRLDTAEMLEMRITEAMTRLGEAKAEANELRHALSVARDHMRVMANWIKRRDDPVAYDWATDAITSVNAVLERGEPK